MANTINDLYEKHNVVQAFKSLFGSTESFDKGFRKRFRAIGDAIRREQNVDYEQATKLPRTTELGFRSQNLYIELSVWLRKQNIDL